MTEAERQKAGRGDYTLSFEEFIEIIGAIREIPRIYSSIEKMESNIQRLTLDQGKEIADLRYRVQALEQAHDRDEKEDQKKLPDTNTGIISQKDLLNLFIKVITMVGAFGSIIYVLVQGLLK